MYRIIKSVYLLIANTYYQRVYSKKLIRLRKTYYV